MPRPCGIDYAKVLDFLLKTEHSRLTICLLHVYHGFLLWFCGPVYGLWALQKKNAHKKNQLIKACIILGTNTSHIIIIRLLITPFQMRHFMKQN